MNEVDTERDCAVVEEEEESFKAKAVNEVDAERDRARTMIHMNQHGGRVLLTPNKDWMSVGEHN